MGIQEGDRKKGRVGASAIAGLTPSQWRCRFLVLFFVLVLQGHKRCFCTLWAVNHDFQFCCSLQFSVSHVPFCKSSVLTKNKLSADVHLVPKISLWSWPNNRQSYARHFCRNAWQAAIESQDVNVVVTCLWRPTKLAIIKYQNFRRQFRKLNAEGV